MCKNVAADPSFAVKSAADSAGAGDDEKIEDCLHCGQCKGKCPYELDTPTLLEKNYKDYQRILAGEIQVD